MQKVLGLYKQCGTYTHNHLGLPVSFYIHITLLKYWHQLYQLLKGRSGISLYMCKGPAEYQEQELLLKQSYPWI